MISKGTEEENEHWNGKRITGGIEALPDKAVMSGDIVRERRAALGEAEVTPLFLLGPASKPGQESSSEGQKPKGGPLVLDTRQEEAEPSQRNERLRRLGGEAEKTWMDYAKKKEWNHVRAPMSI